MDPPTPVLRAAGEAGSTPVVLTGTLRGAADEVRIDALRRAALGATDFSWLSRGDRVLIKPVCNSGNPYPATTDPLALRALVGLLSEKGAGKVLVADMSGVQFVRFSKDRLRGSTRELMTGNGMLRASEEAGAELHAFEEAGWDGFFPETPGSGDGWSEPIWMPAVLKEVDHVVLLPRCSRHLLAGSTLGLKAAVGWWRHDSRLQYHRDAGSFCEKTAEANTVPSLLEKQRLVLTSASRLLTTFGPDQGYVHEPETGLVIASTSVVAHDMVSLAWLLSGRRATPEDRRHGPLDDPYGSEFMVSTANRFVTFMLGGLGQAMKAESLTRSDLNSIWDDRVLRRGFEVLGGVPQVELVDEGGSVPASIREELSRAVELTRVV